MAEFAPHRSVTPLYCGNAVRAWARVRTELLVLALAAAWKKAGTARPEDLVCALVTLAVVAAAVRMGLVPGRVGDAAESGEIDGIELIGPVAAGVLSGRVDEVSLIADVVDGDGHVLGDAALDAGVPEGELRCAAREVEVGVGDAGCGDQGSKVVEVVAGLEELRCSGLRRGGGILEAFAEQKVGVGEPFGGEVLAPLLR